MFIIGIIVLLFSAEKLVDSTESFAAMIGLSSFVISTLFIGFDPENLGVGIVAALSNSNGIVMGTIIGSLMIAIALAFGITLIATRINMSNIPRETALIQIFAAVLFYLLIIDKSLSRIDGAILLVGFIISMYYLVRSSKKNRRIEKTSIIWFIVSLLGIILGSELVVRGARIIIQSIGISSTLFGMTILALSISIEELFRELPAAIKGKADISYGNVFGSIMYFLLFNAGIIALITPIRIDPIIIYSYMPLLIITILWLSKILYMQKTSRIDGLLLIVIYALFVMVGIV